MDDRIPIDELSEPLVEEEPSHTDGRIMDVQQALKVLPEGARIALVLHYMEEKSVREIALALALAITENSVKNRLHYARKVLKSHMQRMAILPALSKSLKHRRKEFAMRSSTKWFRDCGWGVLVHLVPEANASPSEWNSLVDNFDAEGLAKQLEEVGARYLIFTTGHSTGHYCAPNSVLEQELLSDPGKCSRRDLIADLSLVLDKLGIKLLAYTTSGGWDKDICPNLQNSAENDKSAFMTSWERVHREWSLRWKDGIKGWYVDGGWELADMYRRAETPNFKSFSESLKSGNPKSIVAFSMGNDATISSATEYEDYTAGEVSNYLPTGTIGVTHYEPINGDIDGAQYHVLCAQCDQWGTKSRLRLSDDLFSGYAKHTIEHKGVITWGIPVDRQGTVPEAALNQLRRLKAL